MKTIFYPIILFLSLMLLLPACECDCDEEVIPPVTADFKYEKDPTNFKRVAFTNLSENYTSLSWNFGDGSAVSSEESPVHIFPGEGVFTVKLTATGKDGKTSEKAQNVTIVDPLLVKVMVSQPDGATGKDAIVASCVPCSANDNNYGNHQGIIATAWTVSGDPNTLRSLLYFNLSSIPQNATIVSAKLSLYYRNDPGAGDGGNHSSLTGVNTGLIQKITSAWDENTVTWDTQPTSTTTGQVVMPQSTSATQDYPDMDVTTIVKDFVLNPASNHGFMIRLQTESYYRQLVFASSDYTDPLKRPKLEVQYKTN